MKILAVTIAFFSTASIFGAEPVIVSDKRGDADFGKNEPLAAFDLVSVAFEGLPENKLKVTFTGDGPMSEKGTTYSWFAVWLDLDVEVTTGQNFSGGGYDLILGAESVRRTTDWTGDATAKSSVGREFPVKFEKCWTEGNQAFVIYQSELFEKYPIFRAAAFSHHDGAFSDRLYGGKMDYIRAFDATEKSVEAPDPFAFQKLFEASYRKKKGHRVALTPNDRKIEISVTPSRFNGGPKSDPKIDFSINAENREGCAHIRFIQNERGTPFESMVRTTARTDSHEVFDLSNLLELDQKVRLGLEWSDNEIVASIDGEVVQKIPAGIKPDYATIWIHSADVLAEELNVE